MGFKKYILKDQSGQTAVEYILLFAVVMSLILFVFKSDKFNKLFGEQGDFATVYKSEIEYSYRHTLSDRVPYSKPNYLDNGHDSFKRPSGNSRFFGARDAYPQ